MMQLKTNLAGYPKRAPRSDAEDLPSSKSLRLEKMGESGTHAGDYISETVWQELKFAAFVNRNMKIGWSWCNTCVSTTPSGERTSSDLENIFVLLKAVPLQGLRKSVQASSSFESSRATTHRREAVRVRCLWERVPAEGDCRPAHADTYSGKQEIFQRSKNWIQI